MYVEILCPLTLELPIYTVKDRFEFICQATFLWKNSVVLPIQEEFSRYVQECLVSACNMIRLGRVIANGCINTVAALGYTSGDDMIEIK